MHEGTDSEPETVTQTELVAYKSGISGTTRMRIAPFVGRETADEEHGERDASVSYKNVQPDVQCQWFHKRKEPCRGFTWNLFLGEETEDSHEATFCPMRLKGTRFMTLP